MSVRSKGLSHIEFWTAEVVFLESTPCGNSQVVAQLYLALTKGELYFESKYTKFAQIELEHQHFQIFSSWNYWIFLNVMAYCVHTVEYWRKRKKCLELFQTS